MITEFIIRSIMVIVRIYTFLVNLLHIRLTFPYGIFISITYHIQNHQTLIV